MNSRYKFWIAFSLAAVFVIGMATGYFGERVLRRGREDAGQGRRDKKPHFPTLEIISDELGLSQNQQDEIREIFQRNEGRLKAFGDDFHKRLREIRSQIESEISGLLTREQRVKFEAMIEKYRTGRKKDQTGKPKDDFRPEDRGDLK